MKFTDDELKLLSALQKGAENGKNDKTLSLNLDMDPRKIRKLCESVRKKGVVIVGDNYGRYFPQTLPELRGYIQRRQSGVNNELAAIAPAIKLLGEWEDGNI